MELKLILLLVIAHLLSDFILQKQNMSDKKGSNFFSLYHVYHVIIVGITSYLFSFDLGFWKAALLLMILHLFTDMLKSWLIIKYKTKSYFFLDQFIHLASIVLIVLVYSKLYGINFIFDFETKTVAIFAGFLFCAKPSNVLIKHMFTAFSIQIPEGTSNNPNDQGLPNAGKLIGIVERFLALGLIIMGEYEAVGLIIAAKSILRFSGTQKSEYVLVGTLLSFSLAAFSGILINLIS
ncbi:MAG TPA: DUF3307 domain-containing protein [Bacteroidales bacterium]|jgi:hypothetical protein|nr:DUF3307 domain-containing protein [Bacteroidales bacterium]